MTSPSAALLSDENLDALAELARQGGAVPAEVVLALVEGYRHHRDQVTSALCGEVESGDVLGDLAHRLVAARATLKAIAAEPGTLVQLRAAARAAVLADDRDDAGMRAEFGYGLAQVTGGSRRRVRIEPLPADGELRRDLLGNVWAVERTAADDGERVRIRLVESVAGVDTDRLMSASERMTRRARKAG